MTGREAPDRHTCGFCVTLQRLAIRRRDPQLAEAASRLRASHAANDAEREAFARRSDTDPATAQPRRSSMRIAVHGGYDGA